jgi:hypothetical protein
MFKGVWFGLSKAGDVREPVLDVRSLRAVGMVSRYEMTVVILKSLLELFCCRSKLIFHLHCSDFQKGNEVRFRGRRC